MKSCNIMWLYYFFLGKTLGDIDIAWCKSGKNRFGLAHIIENKNDQGIDGEAFVCELPRIIADGDVKITDGNTAIITTDSEVAIVKLNRNKERKCWVITAISVK